MEVGLIAVAFRGAAKLALKEASKSGGKQAVYILFAELFGGEDRRFEELSHKLDVLKSGQKQLEDQLIGLQADVGFRVPLERIHTEVHGLYLAMTRKTSLGNLERILRFLEPAETDSARAFADNLAQKLFGTGQVTPDGFWDPRPKADKTKTLLGAGHVANIARGQFQRNVAPLKAYVDNLMALHTELLTYFALLAGAIITAHQYMLEVGNPLLREAGRPLYALEADDNPALFARPGLAGMASDWILDYVIQSCPPAFDLYGSLFIERKERRIGLTTKARNHMLEWETDGSRKPIQVSGGIIPSHDYHGLKPVYADHEDKGRTNPRQWWRIRPAEAAKSADDAILLKADEGERYLGEYRYLSYSHMTKSGKLQSHSNEIGIGGSASDPLSRWCLHLRRENGQGETTFVLEHKATGRCLLVNGLDSTKDRQIHLDEKVKDRGDWIDYAFKVVDPPA